MHGKRKEILIGTFGLLLAVLAALLHDPLVGRAGLAGGAKTAAGATGIPPSMSAVHLFSGFRPVAADIMWIRADGLFRQGRLWELAALFRGIAALDPRNAAVREFAAWHLAYNVALAERDPGRRFDWFAEGLELLASDPEGSPFRVRTRSFGGRMIADRMVSGVFPGFDARFTKRFGRPPLDEAVAWLDEATRSKTAPPAAFAALLACMELQARRAEEGGDPALAARKRSEAAGVLMRAAAAHPEVEWDFGSKDDPD